MLAVQVNVERQSVNSECNHLTILCERWHIMNASTFSYKSIGCRTQRSCRSDVKWMRWWSHCLDPAIVWHDLKTLFMRPHRSTLHHCCQYGVASGTIHRNDTATDASVCVHTARTTQYTWRVEFPKDGEYF